jgi:hypothetical protein
MPNTLHRTKLPGLLRQLSLLNLIYAVEFTKKNGEKRKLICRGNVSKYVKNTGRMGGAARPSNQYINVYQMNGKPGDTNYRAINLETIDTITTCGIKADISPEPIVNVDCSSHNNTNLVKFA